MNKNISLLIGLLFISAIAVAQGNTEEQKMEVMMKMSSLRNALLSKDSAALSSLLSDDVTYGHSSGTIQTKQELIHDIASGAQDYKSIEPSNVNIRVYENTGVVNMQSHVNVIANGKALDVNMYVTLVWIKKNNNWQLVARQAVKLPQ